MQLGGLPVASDVSAGAWLAEVLASSGRVGALVPASFPAHARVFHPAARYDGDDDIDVEWADVAADNGTLTHPGMQWPGLTGGWEFVDSASQPPTWDAPPSDGHLPVQVAGPLAAVLARHTATPGDCWFGRWVGFAFDDAPLLAGRPTLVLPGREHVLVHGAVADADRNLAPEPNEQSANLWWPADRAWVVATDIDLMSTYVAGSAACIEELLETEGLEVLAVRADDPVDLHSDRVNPVPARIGS